MLKKLPGLIWVSTIAAFLIKKFGPDDPVAWVKQQVGAGGAIVGESPVVAAPSVASAPSNGAADVVPTPIPT